MSKKSNRTLQEHGQHRGHLLEDSRLIQLQLVEDGSTGGKTVVRGEFARCDAATENKRVYPRSLWEREIKRLQSAMKERRLFGELDHPTDGRTQLSRASHILTDLQITDDGRVIGEAEVLPTEKGNDLKGMLQSMCKVGVSSRGYGSTRNNGKGEEVVQNDYNLVTFDFVAEPADNTAFPQAFSEDKEKDMAGTKGTKESELKEPGVVADEPTIKREDDDSDADDKDGDTDEGLQARFERQVLAKIEALVPRIRAEVQAELLADPSIGGAKKAVEQVVAALKPFMQSEGGEADEPGKEKEEEIKRLRTEIAARDLKLKESAQQVNKLGRLAKEAGYRYYIERALQGDPDASLIRKALGDVKVFENADVLKARLSSVREDLKARRTAIQRREQAQREESDRTRKVEAKLRQETVQLQEALEKSLQVNKALGARLYADERLRNHPKAKQVSSLIEQSGLTSREDIDRVVDETLNERHRGPAEVESVRNRVRQATRGGLGSTPKDEERPSPRKQVVEDYNGLGIDLTTLKQLSGTTSRRP